jgi:c(7)-type cytochrome triheme protein
MGNAARGSAMRKIALLGVLGLAFAAVGARCWAADAPKDDKNGPETIVFDKTGKMANVKFPHALHQKKLACKECHEGDKPLFAQKKGEAGLKMADMYKGEACGACHDGKKLVDGKAVFAAKSGCMKCHKKEEVAK